MSKLSLLLVVLSLVAAVSAQGHDWDTCVRDVECPLIPACRAIQNGSLFYPNTFLSDHAFWLPGLVVCPDLSAKFMFTADDLGVWEEFVVGGSFQATLKGTIANKIKPEAKFKVDCLFSDGHPAFVGSVKKEFLDSVYQTVVTDAVIGTTW